ncbi:hypothetical protein [Methanosphaerula subterraneus]|uniref:hypothetical protein n=1 Tax=Methanosphaerula subterraneus TaxID=3350244 RepID=UPI003F869528
MKEDTRWKITAGAGLILLSLAIYAAHYLIFQDAHHLLIYFIGELAFVPIEVLIVTLIIDQMLESREKQHRMEKMKMVIGTFFSTVGTPLLRVLAGADPTIDQIKDRLVVGADWENKRFLEVRACLNTYTCGMAIHQVDMDGLRTFLVNQEDFLLRLVENPVILEHESFTDLILAINHLTEEMKARDDLAALPSADLAHLTNDILRVYSKVIPEWVTHMEYLKEHYPYLFSLEMRRNPFDASASVIIRQNQ